MLNISQIKLEYEEDPLYEDEIDLGAYKFADELSSEDLANDLLEIRQMFTQILENEVKIQRDMRILKNKRLNHVAPVEVVDKTPNQYLSSANQIFDLSKMNLPCSSLEDVHVLEKELTDNLYFEIFFKNFLLEIESYDLASFIKSAMQSIINEDVVCCFSWKGIGENISIKSLKIMQIFIEICCIKFNQTEKALIVHGIRKYLSLVKEKIRRGAGRGEGNDSFWISE